MSRALPAPPFLALGALSLVAGLWAGLLRLPLPLPAPHAQLAAAHGLLMAGAFLGTVISAERAAALDGRPLLWLPALLHGAGGLMLLAGPLLLPPADAWHAASLLLVAGALGLLALSAAVLRRQPVFFNQVMGLGALALAVAHLQLWRGGSALAATPWWAAFLTLTIAGERLELNRLLQPARGAALAFRGILLLLVAALALAPVSLEAAARVQGAGHLLLGLWLARHDIARHTVKLGGLARFAALCLLSGYAWLALAGLLALAGPFQAAGPWHDAALHTLFLGFVFAMIFGHAPIIVPALTGRAVRVGALSYAPLFLLHAGLLLRVAGDLAGAAWARQVGGASNVAAILLFLVLLLAALEKRTTAA